MNRSVRFQFFRISVAVFSFALLFQHTAAQGGWSRLTSPGDVDLVAEFERPIGLNFIEFAEYIENILGKKADILTPEGVRRITVQKIARNIEQSIIYV